MFVDPRLDHCLRVPSDIDSAISGTLTILSAGEASDYCLAPMSSQPTVQPGLR